MTHLTTLQLVTEPGELIRLHDEVLVPSFPQPELCDPGVLVAGVREGDTTVLALRDDRGRTLAMTVMDYHHSSGVALLSYLATNPGLRSHGHGSQVLGESLAYWREHVKPHYVVGEVEDPRFHVGSQLHGDPEARFRFYRRFGAWRFPVDYFQPGIGSAQRRVPHLVLMLIDIAEAAVVPDAEDPRHQQRLTVQAGPIREFLYDYITAAEGASPNDPQARQLLAAVGSPRLMLLPL